MAEEKERVLSIDALRGFDMMFIIGGAALISALCTAFGWSGGWLAAQMKHVQWEGLAHHDTIFPLFLFLAGVSWPFSFDSQVDRGVPLWRIRLRVLKRAAVLFLLGFSFGGILKFNPQFRLMSVLGFIGLSWGAAALLSMSVKRISCRLAVVAALLVGYWALLSFCSAPHAPESADTYSLQWNIISHLDRTVYPNHLLPKNVYEPESLFSVPNGMALALLGMSAGSLLKARSLAKPRKAALLALSAAVLLALGFFFTCVLGDQIVKKLWTTSFVLFSASYSFAMLALFYWIVDVKGFRAWTFPFREIGMNSITIYLFMMFGVQGLFRHFLFSGLAGWVGDPWGKVVIAAGGLFIGWLFVHFLYRRKIFLRV